MIFKNLFRAKYQHPDPKVRMEAIAELSPTNMEQKSQLHELAFNDADPGVILAALKRLNSFPLWVKTADTSSQERVQKRAKQVVEAALLGEGDVNINEQERNTFVQECKNISLLEKLLKQSWLLNGDADLVIQVLDTVNKPHLTLQILFVTSNEALQLALAEQFDDEQTLQKIIKKTSFDSVQRQTQQRLDNIISAKQKPVVLEKHAKLVLSQLLALKDKDNYQLIVERRQELSQDFQKLADEIASLNAEMLVALQHKFNEISSKLDKWQETLQPVWQQEQLNQSHQNQLDSLADDLAAIVGQVADTLEKGAKDITLGQVERFENNLQQIQGALQSLSENIPANAHEQHRQLESMFNRLNSCKTTLESLPEFQNAIESARVFLQAFKDLALPQDISQVEASQLYLKEQKSRWKELTANYTDSFPEDIWAEYKAIISQWKKAVQELQTQIKDDVNRCKSKLRVVENMIAQGRFKPAMSLFHKVNSWYLALPEYQRNKLSRQYDKARLEVENLKDWQAYIAQPRKPALLAEAEALVASPLEIELQAKQVKNLRQQWNSLGKVDSESDSALNDAFELTLEKAFEPCRVFFARRQEKREANLAERYQLIDKVSRLMDQNLSDMQLVQAFRELQKQWQKAGEVDFKQMDDVHKAYRQACEPIQARLDTFYKNNAEVKSSLILKVQSLLQMEDVFQAVEQAKALQEKWKQTGPASKKVDAKLWNEFRGINDQIFARRKESQQEHKLETEKQSAQIAALLDKMKENLQQADDKQGIHHALDEHKQVQELLGKLPFKLKGRVEKQLTSLKDAQQSKLAHYTQQLKTDQYRVLFEGLNSWTGEALPANLENVASQWRGCFEQSHQQLDESRQELTIKLEILADKPSPVDESDLRQKIQLKMMADKLQQGHQHDKRTLLKQWIGLGPLSESDQNLLTRVEGIFISAPD